MIGKIAVIGLGYIGLPTSAALAAQGITVTGVDVNPSTVDAVNRGEVPFVEPDLQEIVEAAVRAGTLTATTEPPEADIYVIAVPTPITAERSADLSYVESATKALAPRLRGGELVLLESTSPPGTTERIGAWIAEARPDLAAGSILLAHCPERVLPGRVMIELVENDRVIGGVTHEAAERAAELYRTFCKGELIITDARTAELAKLVENSYRDVNIAFANELSLIADRLDIECGELIEIANHHPRVNILDPGPGVGGHCIAVDPWFIVEAAPEVSPLIRTAREVNDSKPHYVVDQVVQLVADRPSPTVAVLGLAFKKNIDDLRESPAVQITAALAAALPEASLLVVEPHVPALPSALQGQSRIALAELDDALAQADAVLLLVDHDAFAGVTEAQRSGKAVLDTRGLWRR